VLARYTRYLDRRVLKKGGNKCQIKFLVQKPSKAGAHRFLFPEDTVSSGGFRGGARAPPWAKNFHYGDLES